MIKKMHFQAQESFKKVNRSFTGTAIAAITAITAIAAITTITTVAIPATVKNSAAVVILLFLYFTLIICKQTLYPCNLQNILFRY